MDLSLDELLKLAGIPTANAEERVQSKLQECADMLNYTYELPTIVYDLQGHVAGWAIPSENKIRLNTDLLHTHTEEMIEQTLPHEFAHIVSCKLYGYKGAGHGANWKHVMYQLGLEPSRCHTMDTEPQRKTRKYAYACKCANPRLLGAARHRRCQEQGTKYKCTICNSTLIYIGGE